MHRLKVFVFAASLAAGMIGAIPANAQAPSQAQAIASGQFASTSGGSLSVWFNAFYLKPGSTVNQQFAMAQALDRSNRIILNVNANSMSCSWNNSTKVLTIDARGAWGGGTAINANVRFIVTLNVTNAANSTAVIEVRPDAGGLVTINGRTGGFCFLTALP